MRVRNLIFITSALTLLSFSPASAGVRGAAKCDPLCEAYRHAHSRGPVPSTVRTACVYFLQTHMHRDNVVIKFYDGEKRELDQGDSLHNREDAEVRDRICPGWHFFVEAYESGGYAQLCNSDGGRILEGEDLLTIIRLGRTPPGTRVRLVKPVRV